MRTLQDKICDVLTFVGLLCVIGFGSSSLIPESEPKAKTEIAPTETEDNSALEVDTLEEVVTPQEVKVYQEEGIDSLTSDTVNINTEEGIDTIAFHSGEQEDHSQHHTPDKQEDHSLEHSEPKDGKNTDIQQKDNLME